MIIAVLVILFFLNLSTKLPFTPKGFEFIRSFPELHFLKEFLIILILACLCLFFFNKIQKKYFHQTVTLTKAISIKEIYLIIIIFILSLALNSIGAYFIAGGTPHYWDDLSYLFQAKIFASGKLYLSAPSLKEHFTGLCDIIQNGKWHSKYFPGFPLILMLGVLIKAPWIINPLFGSLSLVFIYLIGRELYSRRIAIYASLLGLFSPFLFFYNTSFLTETTSLFFILIFIFFFIRSLNNDKKRYPFLSGFGLGMSFIIRPYTVIFACLPFITYIFFKNKVKYFNKLAFVAVGVIPFFLFLMQYNKVLTGNAFSQFYLYRNMAYQDNSKYDYPGFHRTPIPTWQGYGLDDNMYTPMKGLLNIDKNFVFLNRDLFGWPISLLFIFIPFLFAKKNKWDILFLFMFFSIIIGYFFFWGSGETRYWFSAIPALLFLTASGIDKLPQLLQKVSIPELTVRKLTIVFIIFCYLFSFSFWSPNIIRTFKRLSVVNYRMSKVINHGSIHNALIIMRYRIECPGFTKYDFFKYYPEFSPYIFPSMNFLVAGLSKNPLDLKGDILYVRDLGDDMNRLLITNYPQRSYFIYEYTLENCAKDYATETEKLYKIPLLIPASKGDIKE